MRGSSFLHAHMQEERYGPDPMLLNDTEAVLVRCGSAERLLARVKQQLERSLPEPPLAPSRGTPGAPAAAEADAAGDGGGSFGEG